MIHLTATTPICIATAPVDFRRGIDGLAALCQQLQQNPRSGTLYAFINRSKTMIRLLVYESNGYWLMTKRLSRGKYHGWPKLDQPIRTCEAKQLRQLLSNLLESAA